MLKARRSQARGLFLTFICCSLVAVLLAAPTLSTVANSVALAKANAANAPASTGASTKATKATKEKTK